jgi:hypothetical protein
MKLIKTLIFIGLLINGISGYCQNDTIIYYNLLDSTISSETNAVKYDLLTKRNNGDYKLLSYILDEKKWVKKSCVNIKRIKKNHFEFDDNSNSSLNEFERVIINHENGLYYIQDFSTEWKIKQEGYSETVFPLIKTGKWIRYASDNYKISEDYYEKNKLIKNIRFTQEGKENISNVFYLAEEMPMYGNTSFEDFRTLFIKRLLYPRKAAENGIQGNLTIEFVIMEDGKIGGYQFVKKANYLLNEEAMRTLTSFDEKWTPGKINGKPVRVLYVLSAYFKLE